MILSVTLRTRIGTKPRVFGGGYAVHRGIPECYDVPMSIYLGFDSHVFDYILAEPALLRGQLIEYLTEAPHQLLISAVNVLEGACCPTADKRGALLRLMFQLSGGCRPLALAGDLFRSEIDSYALGQTSATITLAEEQEGIFWIALNAPEEIEQADIEDANRYRAEAGM